MFEKLQRACEAAKQQKEAQKAEKKLWQQRQKEAEQQMAIAVGKASCILPVSFLGDFGGYAEKEGEIFMPLIPRLRRLCNSKRCKQSVTWRGLNSVITRFVKTDSSFLFFPLR